jgi:molybdopterin-containing oxidoreductase family iron-sulfur binding subunit
VNPQTAEKLGISDGDLVWVETAHEKIKVKARVFKGTMPDVLNLPVGLGHTSGGRWSKGLGANPFRLLGEELDPLTSQPMNRSVQVKVYKV